MTSQPSFVIIGGGPAGLAAGYELIRHGHQPVVLEKGGLVGGISRTEQYKGFHFDMGGHRFFTRCEEVEKVWHDVLRDDFLRRPRLSRIFYKGRFFDYPLKPLNALAGVGAVQAAALLISYCRWQVFPHRREDTFEQLVTNRFGRRLFRTFFKTYTEKVWGISCSELKAEWAAQRIKNLSLKTAILGTVFGQKDAVTSLIESFHYPRRGPGMLWEAVRRRIEAAGGSVHLQSDVTRIHRAGEVIEAVTVLRDGVEQRTDGTHFVSSMPVTQFIRLLDPPAPAEVQAASAHLKYRDFLTVCLIVNKADLFPDNWIYIHDEEAKVGRIQNFKNWSPDMVPDPSLSSVGMEYFCNEGDELWLTPDDRLIDLARRELAMIGLAGVDDVVDGCVFRVPKAYPVYDSAYADHLAVVRRFMDSFVNCKTVGRNGLHRYNNQDHSMLTGMYAVRNLLFGQPIDLWSVNTDQTYQEEKRSAAPPSGQQLLHTSRPGAL